MIAEEIGKVGSRGELYPSKKIRELLNLEPESRVRYFISPKGYLVIEKIISVENLIIKPSIAKMTVEESEKLSEKTQKREGKIVD